MNSSGRSQPSSFLWTQLFLNKVLMVLTSSSNKPFPPISEDFWSWGSAEACGYYRGNVLILLDYSLSLFLCLSVSLSPSLSPLFLPPRSRSPHICVSVAAGSPVVALTRSQTFRSCLCLSTRCIFFHVSSASL